MFQAIFQGKGQWIALLAFTSVALAVSSFLWLKKRQRPALVPSAFVACLVVILGVTLFLPGSGSASRECTLNHQLAEPFRTTQGLLNGLMTVPLGFLGLLASRRRLLTLAAVIAGPCLVELAQASVDAFSRLCDSSDAEMNILGGLVGMTLAWFTARARGMELRSYADERTPALVAVALGVVGVGLAVPGTAFTAVDATSIQAGSGKQATAMRRALDEAFGAGYTSIAESKLQYAPSMGAGGRGTLHFSDDKVDAEMAWPSKLSFTASLEYSDTPTDRSFPIDGKEHPRLTGAQAKKLATQYARAHYPWVRDATSVTATPVADGRLGWLVSWRTVEDRILMPAMLDVQINTVGRISQLHVTRGPSHFDHLPPPKIDRSRAIETVRKSLPHPESLDFRANVLKATRRDGQWNPEYIVQTVVKGAVNAEDADSTDYYVDAHTGRLHEEPPE
ncbi:VanZ family protein [Streptomyces sp. NPDC047123]|uniref:VanZ family protein n=1 Tax=Streptomyces sp. NPDC047123 TaxID=3155622 RepID=UPI0033E17CBA